MSHGRTFRVSSTHEAEPVELDSLPLGAAPPWVRYVLGPAQALVDRGVDVPPVSVHVDSDVPVGAGLSSSAAVVCAVTTALDELLGLRLSPEDLLAVARAAENDVVGAPTGGLDQLASLRSEADHVLLCDFRDLSSEPVPFDPAAAGLEVLVVDTRTRHAHADGEYARRRSGCEEAARLLGVPSLREVGVGDLDAALEQVGDLAPYVRHVVTENHRVLQTVAALRVGSLEEIGPLLTASHASLRDDYRVTVPALDLAASALGRAGALGARMTGGGFGGCVIALVPTEITATAVAAVRDAFEAAGLDRPVAITTRPTEGAHRL